jgi:hypothetical protein
MQFFYVCLIDQKPWLSNLKQPMQLVKGKTTEINNI